MSQGAAILPALRLYTPRLAARRDWNEMRARIDLAKVAAALLGAPIERRGLQTALLGWRCPFDMGPTVSLRVNVGETSWSCSTCGAGGDAAALVMRIKGMAFREAIAWLDEQQGFSSSEVGPNDHDRSRAGTDIHVSRHDSSTDRERAVIMNGGGRRQWSPGTQPD